MIVIASDHAGFNLKQQIIDYLAKNNFKTTDLGCNSLESVDYPDYANLLGSAINTGKADTGILICGSGIGMSIAANRFKKVRAALCINAEMAKLAKAHNNANILVLGARFLDKKTAIKCLQAFLDTKFEEGRHKKRIEKLEEHNYE